MYKPIKCALRCNYNHYGEACQLHCTLTNALVTPVFVTIICMKLVSVTAGGFETAAAPVDRE